MTRFSDDVLDAIRQAADVVELIGRYVVLRSAGRSQSGRCPFHDEKTPSFHVWRETGTWKCFGCGKGGNVFTFLMEREGLTFPEAVRQLARDVGIELEKPGPGATRLADERSRLREIHEWACAHFEAGLRSPAGAPAREYLRRRGVLGETAARFRLGFAPPGWDNLFLAAERAGYGEDELLAASLVIERSDSGEPSRRGRRVYDRFRNRIVFPIADVQGRVIAFGARALGDEEPKYINSSETALFTKGRHLYALHLAKDAMLRTGEGAVMEGYTDVIMAHQAGWPVAVAGLGTALTAEQARRVSRYVKKLWLVYDGDEAGLRAAGRAVPAFLPESLETRVALLPAGADPFDLMRRDGLAGLQPHLDASLEAFDHLLDAFGRTFDRRSAAGEAAATEAALRALAPLEDRVKQDAYLRRIVSEYGIPAKDALSRLREIRSRRTRGAPSPDDAGPPDEPRRLPDPPAAERLLLEAVTGAPALLDEVERAEFGPLSHPLCRELLECLLVSRVPGDGPVDVPGVLHRIDDPELAAFAAGVRADGEGKDLLRQGRDCIRRLEVQFESRDVQEALRKEPESDELLRRLVLHHQRRAGRPEGA